MTRAGVCSANQAGTVLTDHGVAVPVLTRNNLFHHVGRRADQLVDRAFVSPVGLSGHHRCIYREGGGVGALCGVAVEVIRRTLTGASTTDVEE